jgi:hypothetical protein
MLAVKAYKYKLKTKTKFVAACCATLDVCRELYNAALQERRDAYQINLSDQRTLDQLSRPCRPDFA